MRTFINSPSAGAPGYVTRPLMCHLPSAMDTVVLAPPAVAHTHVSVVIVTQKIRIT
jgi:hypothetical protein